MKKEIVNSLLEATGSTAVDFIKGMMNQSLYLKKLRANIRKELQTMVPTSEPQALLRTAHVNRDLVLVLGAGVSICHNLPTWEILLQRLLIKVFDESPMAEQAQAPKNIAANLSKLYSEVFQTSPLISARYLRDHYSANGPMEFEKAVREALYESFTLEQSNDLFRELRDLCIAQDQSPNVNCVITYNYDDILETFLTKSSVSIKFIPVHAVGMNPSSNELPIYHVHGYLPSRGEINDNNRITLSEDGYHNQYQDIYSWSNMVQINKFKDNTCLFIGTSFTDPNLRRLLDIAVKQRGESSPRHVLIKRRVDVQSLKEGLLKIIGTNPELAGADTDEIAESLIAVMEDFEENDALSFGVRIHWIYHYDEIPQVLRDMRSGPDSALKTI